VRAVVPHAGISVVFVVFPEKDKAQYISLLISVGTVTAFPRSSYTYIFSVVEVLLGKISLMILLSGMILTCVASGDARISTSTVS
jgi:hypothetical protein